MKLDSYEVLGLLGSGGMGEVYRARDSALKRDVAIKILPSYVSQDPDRLRRFEQEAQAAAALNHPNILAVYQFGVFQGTPYLVSELLEGDTLRHPMQRGPMPVRKAMDYSIQIASGLAAAHERGIVHRDLKPDNLMVTKDGRIKILDFGLAKLMQHYPDPDGTAPTVPQNTNPGVVMGTAGYMSPEQVRGKIVDHRTDIFAFGAILYEMLAGKRAFHRSTSAETMTAILNDDPPNISPMQTAPPGLQRVVHRCLEKNPEQRFQSASDLAFALEALSESGTGPLVAAPRGSRLRWPWLMAGTAVAALLIAIAWWRMPPAVPAVESITQLTDDGRPKLTIASDSSRIYFSEGETGNSKIRQVSVTGGAIAPVEVPFANSYVASVESDGSSLVVGVPTSTYALDFRLWSIPLPAGEPRRIGGFETQNVDVFPDGRIVFAQFVQGKDPNGADSKTNWLIGDKDGSNTHELVSFPGFVGDVVSVAPDSRRILLVENHNDARRLFEIGADGKGLREIRKLRPDECCFIWTPDEKYLVYQSATAQQTDIWLLPLKTGLLRRQGNPIRLTNGPLPYSYPYASKDGKGIFVLGTKQRGELVRYDMKSHQFQPFLSGISATDPTFSRNGKWVAYVSYPDDTLWRSRSDGSERMQLTYPPMNVVFPAISPDGTKISFHTGEGKLFVISLEGGTPQKLSDNAIYASWSPDGNYLFYHLDNSPFESQIIDVRNGKKSSVPFGENTGGFWLDQDTLVGVSPKETNFITFDLKTRKSTDLGPKGVGTIVNWMVSPDGKYLYFTTAGAEPRVERLRFADQRVETITTLKDFHRVTQINVAPDGSPLFTRDTGYQEIYALKIRWP